MQKFKSVEELVKQLRPTEPVYCIRKKSIQLSSKYFKNKFSGKILYAVKTNPHQIVLKTIIESGINNFDVASIKEIEAIKNPLKMFHKVFYNDTDETLMTIKKKDFSHLQNTFVKVIVTNKNEPYWFDVFVEELIKAQPADLKVVEDHSNLDVLNEDELVGDAEDTLTILTKHIDSLNIDGDKTKLDTLMRSLYTESLDILV